MPPSDIVPTTADEAVAAASPGHGQPPIVFVHVMKCGGTSLRAALRHAVAAEWGDESVFELDGKAADWAAGLSGHDAWHVRDLLTAYMACDLRRRLIVGHIRVAAMHQPLLDSAAFVTVLRDPVERFVSLHHYRRTHAAFRITADSLPALLDEKPDVARRAGEAYVELFATTDGPSDRPAQEADVASACATLSKFAAVGRLENLAPMIEVVNTLTPRPLVMPRLNATPPGDRWEPIDPGVRRAIEELCAPSLEVYEFARSLPGGPG